MDSEAESDDYWFFWRAEFRFAGFIDWYEDRAKTDLVVEALGATALWNELNVIGHSRWPGRPLGTIEATKRMVDGGEDGYMDFTLARGNPRATADINETDAQFVIAASSPYLTLTAGARGDVLDRMGPALLDDMIVLVLRLRDAWKSQAHLQDAMAFPSTAGKFRYPRVDPPRTANRPLHAIVDIVDPTFEPYDDGEFRVAQSKAIAKAELPDGVTRIEHDGVVVQRWVDDPRDRDAVAAAAGRHEAWMVTVIDTEIVGR